MTQTILFFVFAAIVLGSGLAVVTVRNLFHAALWLLLAFFGVAGLHVLLEAPFFAAVQLFVYMGAIGILIIFAIMLTQDVMQRREPQFNDQWVWAALAAVVLLGALVWLTWLGGWETVEAGELVGDSMNLLGRAFVNPEEYALPFELASVLLVAALIGAVTIAREQ
jgi:NADH-quinone oxidoreductase subunit J